MKGDVVLGEDGVDDPLGLGVQLGRPVNDPRAILACGGGRPAAFVSQGGTS